MVANGSDPGAPGSADSDAAGDIASILAQRRTPRVYVIDAAGDVILRGVDDGHLGASARDTVAKLIAHPNGSDDLLGFTADNELVRLIRLSGSEGAHYALFVERLSTRSPIDSAAERYGLSEREREVLRFILRGASASEIAEQLFIAESTVATHVRNIGSKMEVTKRKAIVAAVLGKD